MSTTSNIVSGLLTGRLDIRLGCKKTMRLKRETHQMENQTGAKKGGLSVDATLWAGSKRFKALAIGIQSTKDYLKSLALPWEDGKVIFRADKATFITTQINHRLDELDKPLNELVDNYDAEVLSAVQFLGVAGDEDNYPNSGQEFSDGFLRKFIVAAVSPVDRVAEMVSGAIGKQLVADAEADMAEKLADSQKVTLERLAKAVKRIANACAEDSVKGKGGVMKPREQFKFSDDIISSLIDLTREIPGLLLAPDEDIERLAEQARAKFAGLSKEALKESKDAREQARQAAADISEMLSIYDIGV